MPHVVIHGDISLRALYDDFEPIEERAGDDVLKVTDVFLNHSGRVALLECVVVERRPMSFFVQLARHEDRVTVRLFPPTDPQKTDGVRRILARIAWEIVRRFPGSRYGATNLEPFLNRGE